MDAPDSSLLSPFSEPAGLHIAGIGPRALNEPLCRLDIDVSSYVSERRFAMAKDGTRIPYDLIYKKGLKRDGNNPAFMSAYGSYGLSGYRPSSAGRTLALIDQGAIVGYAAVRGGGEYGRDWHRAGSIDVEARHLVGIEDLGEDKRTGSGIDSWAMAASGRFFACMVRLWEQYLSGTWECKIAGALRRTIGETARDRPGEPAEGRRPVSTFEYAMVLISIIIGLGITHILSSLGSAVHRLRHHGRSLRIEINYLVWVAFIFTWLMQFWWWEFRWSELVPALDVGIFSFLVLYSVALFMLSVILVPHQLAIIDDSWEYFLSIRFWFYGGLLVLNAIDLIDSLMKGLEWGLRAPYLWYWVSLTAACVVGLFTTRRILHIAFGSIFLIWANALTFYELFVLGNR